MSAIGPGDWVECIDPDCDGTDGVRLGSVHQVAALRDGPGRCIDCGDTVGLDVVGGEPDPEEAFCVCQFRPIYRPKEGAFDHLLKPVDVKVDA